MRNVSVTVDAMEKDENADWVVDVEGGITISCEDGTDACSESVISIGVSCVKIEDLVEFLQFIGYLPEEFNA